MGLPGSAWVGVGQGIAPARTPITIARRRRWGTPKSAALRIVLSTLKPRDSARLWNSTNSAERSSSGTFSITKARGSIASSARRYSRQRPRRSKPTAARFSGEKPWHGGPPITTSAAGKAATSSIGPHATWSPKFAA